MYLQKKYSLKQFKMQQTHKWKVNLKILFGDDYFHAKEVRRLFFYLWNDIKLLHTALICACV